MAQREPDETRDLWNRVAADWQRQVGADGDRNRILSSDPVLWSFLGEVQGRRVLDAGCGTGYLAQQLHARGAQVTGIDHSDRMIEIARAEYPGVEFRVDSCAGLTTCADAQFDLLTSNYVLMDLADLEGAVRAFHRVLCPGGIAVVVFSHPCFPLGAGAAADGEGHSFRWKFPYFSRSRVVDPPWGHFRSDFIWFHRPLSRYWKAFQSAGFMVLDFEEPRLTEERFHLAATPRELHKASERPYSVAFKLSKEA